MGHAAEEVRCEGWSGPGENRPAGMGLESKPF